MTMSEAEKYEILEKIGHGSFGIIRKVKRKSDGHVLCRKEISYMRMSQKEKEQLHAEYHILSSLRHPNIVAYYQREHLKASQDLHLYMEYCGNGDLGRVIKDLKAKNQFAEEEYVWSIFSQLVTALYRCHYGVDPPEVGRNVLGLGNNARPLKSKGEQVMILHRDLKPENVFLGADNSVKLGDFGLSKIMQSHDFASTYVGTPFYMSPEICAAERYTLHSDIWSLGCIMYELCAKEPPFNARTHIELVQKIRIGKVASLPSFYSPTLQGVINDCLKVNPILRPDTAKLLNLPFVKLMRKEKEVVELGQVMKQKEETAMRKEAEATSKIQRLETEKVKIREDIEASLRREWEVKARLEIDRQIQLELERLHKKFDAEVHEKVAIEVRKQMKDLKMAKDHAPVATLPLDVSMSSSINTATDTDFPSITDLSELSPESPISVKSKALKKGTRTPFARAQTFNVGSPVDVQMGEPSPMCIASLSLSPRRNSGATAGTDLSKNIFAGAEKRWEPTIAYSEDEDEDDLPPLPSPTRQKAPKDPFKGPTRPGMLRQKTAPLQKLNNQPNIFGALPTKVQSQPVLPTLSSYAGDILTDKHRTSPNRPVPRQMLSTTLANDSGSPVRKTQAKVITNKAGHNPNAGGEDMFKAVMQRNMGGRTLVELAQARAGGRTLGDSPSPEKKLSREPPGSGEMTIKFAARLAEREVVWDPEKDEMPSPFLVRGGRGLRRL
ncbi:MAG: G2-specific serine/threonine protein kinase [Pycnora praestabilis]|nr:MAG: G2-specific serine/threonine protein kinase [Pycnora praestabilis]